VKSLQLGDLEIEVLNHLWRHDELDAKQIWQHIQHDRGITLSTVQSAIERLCKKNLVTRTKVSHAFRYRALLPREQLVGQLIVDVMAQIGHRHAAPALSSFLDMAEQIDDNALSELERLIQLRRESRQALSKDSGENR
jgi:predicted transcriptional regulator